MRKNILLFFLILMIIFIVIFNIAIDNNELPYLNYVNSYDDDRYYLLYHWGEKQIIDGEYVNPSFDKKYFYYLKDDQKDIVLIDYVRNIKEINNKLYVIGVSPNETMDEMVYKYFVLDYDSDKLFEYSSLNDMSENDKNIFIEKIDEYFKYK